MANEFLVSVADAVLRNPSTGEAIAYGTANLSSALTLSMTETVVRGGINNPVLYKYMHDKNVDVRIEQATFDKTILALNAGSAILNSNVEVLQTDCIDLVAGVGTLSAIPVGAVSVFLPDGTIQSVTPAGTNITVVGGGAQKIHAVYVTMVHADRIVIGTTQPPSVVDLTLIAEIRNTDGVLISYLQINVPRYQVNGNYTLSLAANGVSTQALEGTALAVPSKDCVSGAYYATVTWISAGTASMPIGVIAATPSQIRFSVAGGLPQTRQISVLGIRGGLYANTNITTSASFVGAGLPASLTVSAAGLVTAGSSATAGQSGSVRVTYFDATSGSIVDTVLVSVIA